MKYFLILTLTLITAACSSPDTLGDKAAEQSKAYEKISEQYEKGEKIARSGEKEVEKGKDLVEDGRKDVKRGEEMIRAGNIQIQRSKANYADVTGTTPNFNDPAMINSDARNLRVIARQWQDGIESVEKGQERIEKGNEKIKKGEKRIREGNKELDKGNDLMRRAESDYKSRRSAI